MNTSRLKEMLQRVGCGRETTVLACNELPVGQKPSIKTLYVVNMDENWLPGTHWIVLFIASEHEVEIFDSLCTSPEKNNKYIHAFVNMFDVVIKNAGKQLQDVESDSCGLFCVYYAYYRCKGGLTMQQIVDDRFSDDALLNECKVVAFTTDVYGESIFSDIKHSCK